MTAFTTTIAASATQKNLSTVSAVLVNATETAFSQLQQPQLLEQQATTTSPNGYVSCILAPYTQYSSLISNVLTSEGTLTSSIASVAVSNVLFWDSATLSWTSTCTLNSTETTAPQQVLVTVTSTKGAVLTTDFVVNDTTSPGIANVILAGPTAGTVQSGDTITVVFNTTMQPGSFCPGDWTATNYPNLNAVVALSHSSTVLDNTLYVESASGCTSSSFNFGSIDLGSNGFVGGPTGLSNDVTFASTIAFVPNYLYNGVYDAAIEIALGTPTVPSGVQIQNTASTLPATYTASLSILTVTGQELSNSPFTLSSGQPF
jgi:hypothetical protein